MKQRIITALILAIVFIGTVLFAETRWVGLLLTLILFAATRELFALCLRLPLAVEIIAAAVFAALFWWSLSIANPPLVQWQALAGTVLWGLIALALVFYRHSGNWPLLARVLVLGLALDLLWICVHSLVYLHYVYGGWLFLYLFTLIWLADIGAFFVGRRFGRRKLAPVISPGKSWEGVGGGFAAILVWMLLVYFSMLGEPKPEPVPFLLIGIVSVAISIVGDLFVSMLKREAGVKDSGKLLPGHGGVLDRIDSVIAATPVFLTGLLFVGAT